MPIDSFRLRVRDGAAFVFLTCTRPARLNALSERLRAAGANSIGPGAFSFDTGERADLEGIAKLFESLEVGEQIYVLRAKGGTIDYGVIGEGNVGGIVLTP